MISFIRSFVELNENQYYLNDQMVEDPVARIRMTKAVARETLHFEGQTYYFISTQTRDEFAKRHGTAVLEMNGAATRALTAAAV